MAQNIILCQAKYFWGHAVKHSIEEYRSEIIGSFLCLTLGMLSGYGIQVGDGTWYASLLQPSFAPPNWLFGPVWAVLYIMMGIALGKLWNDREHSKWLLWIFAIQFALNLAWTPIFFNLQRLDWALYDICLLWLYLVIFMALSWRRRSIFMLFLPYFLWVSFATVLYFNIFKLNMA